MRRNVLTWALAMVLAACGGGGNDTSPPPPPSEGSATIDAAGGEVSGPDGVRLLVPAGALSAATTVRIARDGSGAPELRGAHAISPIYSVTPHGTAFAESARISIPFKPEDVAPGTRPMLLRAQPGGRWQALVTDVQGDTVSAADTPGLSFYAVGTCLVARQISVSGPDPLLYCPTAHTLELVLLDASGAAVPVVRNANGVAQPVMTITAPTNVTYRLTWTRPAGTQRTDLVSMRALGVLFGDPRQPLVDFPVNRNFTQTFTTTIDPATVPQASVPGGTVVRLNATAAYEEPNAYYPGCLCYGPAYWEFAAEIPIRVQYGGPQPVITVQPQNQSVVENQSATFSVTATGTNLSYQWYGQTAGATTPVRLSNETRPSYTRTAALADNGLLYYVKVCGPQIGQLPRPCIDSNYATLNVARFTQAPTFTVQPQSITVTEGETASFNATASGTPAPAVGWVRLRTAGIFATRDPVPGCNPVTGSGTTTASTCTLGAQALAESGARYVAEAGNGAGSVDSNVVTVTVLPRPVAPTLTTPAEPADRTVQEGGSVTWTVGAEGTAPLSFAWRTVLPSGGVIGGIGCEGGYNVAPASGPTVTLANIPLACNGHRFFAVVSNSVNPPAESRRALLTVTPAPAAPIITTPLQDRSVLDGTPVTFGVVATGTPPTFTYTWTLDAAAVPGVVSGCTPASATCTFTARLAQTGKTVRVVVSNGTAPDASSSATLTVTTNDVEASITQQPANASTVEGGSAGFSIGVAGTPTPTVTWETSTDGVAWISAATGTTFTITGATLAQNGLRVRAVVTNRIATQSGPQDRTVQSNVVTLTVTPASTPRMVILAGDFSGGGAVDGTGTQARFDFPEGITADAAGNLYVAQTNGDRVARISPTAVVSTIYNAAVDGRVAGSSNVGHVAIGPNGDLYAAAVSYCAVYRIQAPASASPIRTIMTPVGCTGASVRGLAVDASGSAHLSTVDSNSIFRVASTPTNTANGAVYDTNLFAGSGNPYLPGGYLDATGGTARFNAPRGMAFAANGDLFVADSANHVIRRITPAGVVTTFAGAAGEAGSIDGAGPAARFNTPIALAFDPSGNLVVLELGTVPPGPVTARVRRITPASDVSTLFDATAEAVALAQPGQESFAGNLKGVAVLGSNRIALVAGNAVLLRTLP
jgi:sugar lactone lactonase YvrE